MPGDDPAVIGSGPTVPDPTTLADARGIVGRYRLDLPEIITRALANPENETPKPGNRIFDTTEYRLVTRPADAFRVIEAAVQTAGYDCVMLGEQIEGEGPYRRDGAR